MRVYDFSLNSMGEPTGVDSAMCVRTDILENLGYEVKLIFPVPLMMKCIIKSHCQQTIPACHGHCVIDLLIMINVQIICTFDQQFHPLLLGHARIQRHIRIPFQPVQGADMLKGMVEQQRELLKK